MDIERHGSILIVDDDPSILETTNELLKAYGFPTLTSGSAPDALQMIQQHKVDVVLSDIVMPEHSGIELLMDINEVDPTLPVILMTGYADLDKAVDAIKKHAFDFIIKPYMPEQLVMSVERALKYADLVEMERNYKSLLEEFAHELEGLVTERTMSLMAMTVADRVRNPASVIGLKCTQALKHEGLATAVRDTIIDIAGEARKLDGVVRDFHALFKGTRSKFEYDDLNRLVSSVIPVVERKAALKKVSVKTMLPDDVLNMNMQRNLLKVAVFHLLVNAIEASPTGGTVTAAARREDDRIVLSITDSGPGIAEEDYDKVFQPFVSSKKHSFGMGLPLVRQIVYEHMGEIKITSVPEQGTTFTLSFPERWL